ncbi:ABCA1 lipid exporter [Phytophthora palmivora]|uniref:ABCA1 lipid exporter n=1 Tax=Phytophthora palmivora TaxID=4796 RepID=A0A2P4XZF4_9STRA|nr:ABCA1 lipid exporter [Phytophthora palmivora]
MERQNDFARFKVRSHNNEVKLSKMFALVEDVKTKMHIREYSVSQTTLEQIFNSFASQQEEEKGAARSKDKAIPRKETRKAASKAASKPTGAAAAQRGSPRRSRSRFLSPDDRPNPPFAYRDHSPGAESPDFDIPLITGSESEEATTGSTKDPSPAQDAPSQDAPVDDSESSEDKAAPTSSPAKNLTLEEERSPLALPFESLVYRKVIITFSMTEPDGAKEEGAITEPQEI